jgi:inositol oxygenase
MYDKEILFSRYRKMTIFRDYISSGRQDTVEANYRANHSEMTMEVVNEKRAKWLSLSRGSFSIKEIIELVDELVDVSDPDTALPNSIHDFQTAESIRAAHPDDDWLHLVGLLHDLGKVLAVWGEPQHFVVGDTFVLGCKFPEEIIFHKFFEQNPDSKNEKYNTEYGVYTPNCGLSILLLSWGHDEYLYHVLRNSSCTLPAIALDVIRYHSFYPWHTGGCYQHLTTKEDQEKVLPWVKEFNKFDLYSKSDEVPDCQKLWKEYYEPLCKKYGLAGKIKW